MNLADLSIKRPIFMTCIIIVSLVLGFISMIGLPVDQMPDVNLPTLNVTVVYPGAGPQEIENLITKPLEDQIGTISGIKRVTSKSLEGFSQVTAEFQLEVDVLYAEQQIRDKVTLAKSLFPNDNAIREPSIRRFDPADRPIMTLSLQGDLTEQELYDLADQNIKLRLEQIDSVGQVQISGGRKREVQVHLDREKLKKRQLSVAQVSNQLRAAGENIPGGKVNEGDLETLYRSVGEFRSLSEIAQTIVSFQSNEVSTKLSDLGVISDTLEDEVTRSYVNGKKSLFLNVYKQSGSNTLAVTENIKNMITSLSVELKDAKGAPLVEIVQDGSKAIRDNVWDVQETIIIGIFLTIIVVFFFLGSGRSTIITSLALPNSLLGAFILMSLAGFTINVISLLALTLAVGLLIDDAIVVRENIFRHLEMGKTPEEAARVGTKEVTLAVIATTAVVIAVFAPVGFMSGIIGQFFKQFGLTICFAMLISLFDALTIAPMLSTYLAEAPHSSQGRKTIWSRTVGVALTVFNNFQNRLERSYEKGLRFILKHPLMTLFISLIVFVICMATATKIPFVFIPDQDSGELVADFDMPPGINLEAMSRIALAADEIVRKHPEVGMTTVTVGGRNNESNVATMYVRLKPRKERTISTPLFREQLRQEFENHEVIKVANPRIKNASGGGGGSALMLNLVGANQQKLEEYSLKLVEMMKADPAFRNVDTSYRPGKPEVQLHVKSTAAPIYGINTRVMGDEIRAQVEGALPAKFREDGKEYNIRVRLEPDQRSLKENFDKILIPNINNRLIRLSDIAEGKSATTAASIDRLNRSRYIQITGDVGAGLGTNEAIAKINKYLEEEIKLPPEIRAVYAGSTESFQDMIRSFAIAIGLGILFIFLVLASLYESFITPFAIMLALPLAICGAFVAIFLANEVLSLFALLGIIMLLGVACKNSILLVDATRQLMEQGMERAEALVEAGKIRLRPILMTSIALIAGIIPVAIGLNEASAQRTSMGYGIIGGLVSSTLLTLVVVPAAFTYIDRFRIWSGKMMKMIFAPKEH